MVLDPSPPPLAEFLISYSMYSYMYMYVYVHVYLHIYMCIYRYTYIPIGKGAHALFFVFNRLVFRTLSLLHTHKHVTTVRNDTHFELFRSYTHTHTLPLSEMTPKHYGQPLYIIKKDLNMVKSKKTSFSCARTRQMCSFKRTHTHHTHKRYLCPKRHTHYRKCPYNIKGDLHIVNAMGWLRVVASLK